MILIVDESTPIIDSWWSGDLTLEHLLEGAFFNAMVFLTELELEQFKDFFEPVLEQTQADVQGLLTCKLTAKGALVAAAYVDR